MWIIILITKLIIISKRLLNKFKGLVFFEAFDKEILI